MEKYSISLGRINKYMKLSLHVIIDIVEDKYKKTPNSIERFNYGGNKYFQIHTTPFIRIDITKSGDKQDGWNSALTMNLNSRGVYKLTESLDIMIEGFKEKTLFYTIGGRLMVRSEIAERQSEVVNMIGKAIKMMHCVVPNEENPEILYEGIIFMMNSVENFCYLTYDDILYFRYLLQKVDMYGLTATIINTYLIENGKQNIQPVKSMMIPFNEEVGKLPSQIDTQYVKVEKRNDSLPDI